jgi:hypothetical protein
LTYPFRSKKRIFTRRKLRSRLAPRAKITGTRAHPRIYRRRPRLNPRFLWSLLGAGAVLFLVIVLVILLRSPAVSGIIPKDGSLVSQNPVHVEASLKSNIDASQVQLLVNGEDRTAEAKVEGGVLSADLALEDGDYELQVKVEGKTEAVSRFQVDCTPPTIQVEGWETREDGITVIRGKVEGGNVLLLENREVDLAGDGSFQVEVDSYEYTTVLLVALDSAGNRREISVDASPPPKVKGIHVSIWVAADKSFFNEMVDLLNATELNGMEIDVKDESGRIAYASEVPLAMEIGSPLTAGGVDIDRIMDKCWYYDIYPIARVVCFKDPILAAKRPDLAVRNSGGGLWGSGKWLDPYNKEVWDYLLAVCMEAARKGFKEIQLDYVRFPSDGDTTTAVYPAYDGRDKKEVIADFLEYMRAGLKPLGVVFSADVFGLTASHQGEMGIGQDVPLMARYLDYLCPMVYPSHYNTGEYGIGDPEANPHDTVFASLKDFQSKLEGTNCKLRPWLQDFSLRLQYGAAQVQAQINACYELGIDEWLLWDPHCTYTEGVLQPSGEEVRE